MQDIYKTVKRELHELHGTPCGNWKQSWGKSHAFALPSGLELMCCKSAFACHCITAHSMRRLHPWPSVLVCSQLAANKIKCTGPDVALSCMHAGIGSFGDSTTTSWCSTKLLQLLSPPESWCPAYATPLQCCCFDCHMTDRTLRKGIWSLLLAFSVVQC